MLSIPWYAGAVVAALMWGVHYVLLERLLEKMSILTVLLILSIPALFIAPFVFTKLKEDITNISSEPWTTWIVPIVLMFTSWIGAFGVYHAIDGKNATLASLIEISYPFFVAIFAMLILKENHINMYVGIGGCLVASGVALIILKG